MGLLFSFTMSSIYYSCLLQETLNTFLGQREICATSLIVSLVLLHTFPYINFVTKWFCYVQVFSHSYFGILEKNRTFWRSATTIYYGICIIVYSTQAPAPQNEGNQMLSLHENTRRYYACKGNTPSPCIFEGQDTHTFGMLPHS